MTDYAGVALGPHEAPPLDFTSGAIANWSLTPARDLTPNDDSSPAMPVVWNDLFPLEMPENVWSAQRMPCYVDDYYYRFWVYPDTFNEFILTDLTKYFTIWNAFLEPAVCTAVNITNPTELSLNLGTGEPPFTLWTLRTRIFGLDIPKNGLATFTSRITFDFGAFGEPLVVFTGTRIVVFGWELLLDGARESLEGLINIITARDGSEQRICLRRAPRQGLSFRTYFGDEEIQARFDVLSWRHQKRAWGLPMWQEHELHTDTINATDTVIYLDTSYADYRDESMAIIWQGPWSYEVVQVSTVEADRLNLSAGVQSTWTGSKYVMPLRVAVLLGMIERPAAPDGFGWAALNFLVKDNRLLTGYSPATTYQGYTVITEPSIVEKEQEVEQDGDVQWIDPGFGTFETSSDSEYNKIVVPHVFRREGKASCWDFRLFWHSLRMRREPVWIPTFKEDMILQDTINPADSAFYVEHSNFALNMGVNDMRKHLAFVFPDGTFLFREVSSIVEYDADTETVTVDTALGVTIAPGDCEICWLDLCRLTEDKVEWDWEEPFRLRCEVHFTRVSQ